MDMNQLGLMAAQLQQGIARAKEEAAQAEVTGQAGGGLVEVVATGEQRIVSIRISDAAYEDKEMLEDLVTAAVNDAVRKSQELVAAKLKEATGGLPLPPGLGF